MLKCYSLKEYRINTMQNAFKHVLLIGKYQNSEMRAQICMLAEFLQQQNITVFIESATAQYADIQGFSTLALADVGNQVGNKIDLAIVLGGDGTMLSVARALYEKNVPLIGVNRGRFGFLTDINSELMTDSIARILAGEYSVESRLLLTANISRAGKLLYSGIALNDLVVSKAEQSRLMELELSIDNHYVNSMRADGLIVATPTGTTAYALSAGGPILYPTLEAITLVPICPHTLTNRPIAINSNSVVEITIKNTKDARAHLDGQEKFNLQEGDIVRVERAPKTVTLLHPLGHNHFDMLREKLSWG